MKNNGETQYAAGARGKPLRGQAPNSGKRSGDRAGVDASQDGGAGGAFGVRGAPLGPAVSWRQPENAESYPCGQPAADRIGRGSPQMGRPGRREALGRPV